MITRVLVAMDGSEVAERALRYALEVHEDAAVVVLHVAGEPSSMMGEAAEMALAEDLEGKARDRSEELIERAGEIATEYDTTVDVEVAVGRPGKRIVERAEDFDTVVVGTHDGSLVDRLLVGNVAQTVFRGSPVSVTVVR
ncbi:Nucleotide-binding universal stress protein, UspA family [Halorubrum aquaticum]|uniref:Nucleotide-binding universal stress protein, UspA family n=1 Tax=Halorubrum aquaticum TaxID=387340 RepID=A0A1I2ZS60_9EURY|nr:universal stress protein [Halorubrum aquaticum]SFH40540.1 Nucleotide-binding universal stress protein, UspA family [Halorubrum aquaticum]